ncbi:HD domain-containing phosphohydrolase [Pseudomonas mangiferae]|uniref:HD domain-containing protein n=1 Tax=Pseudomonas mangiferae TaxID=2593654 RepID=A0A553GZ95_9PSED|nr:HD domain-containing phosphohydrolase [Pseudomonas mangiferae]TRX74829.1 HD domain-containing protein [Pseudomonas mangiferae]
MPAQPSDRRFPLHVHISLLFTLLLLLSGITLGLFNYWQTSRIILSGSDHLFGRIRQDVERDLRETYQPIRQLLGLLALSGAGQARDGEQRLAWLPAFAQALRDDDRLASLYLGYPDGDFFMVRPLRSEDLRRRLAAPPGAALQVWSIDRGGEVTRAVSLFFDEQLNLLERRPIAEERYDPRQRDWFVAARGDAGQITTAPYVFFSSHDVGTTLARRVGDDAVIAADLTLAQLSATLAASRLTPSSEVVLFTPTGEAIAYPREDHLIPKQERTQLPRVADLSEPLRALLEQGQDEDRQALMLLAKRRWLVSYSHLAEGGPGGLRLALLTPEDELLEEAYRIRWQSAVLTLAILLLCIPLGWLLSRILVRPLQGLVAEAEAIRRFDFGHPASSRSPVAEVDRLALAMARMKETLSSFLEITASLSAETRFDALLRRVLKETVDIGEACGGLIYLVDADSGRLQPQGLILEGQVLDPQALRLDSYEPDDAHLPHWLAQPATGGASLALSLGYDRAEGFEALLNRLGSPRIHLVSSGLHNRRGDTVGVLVLLHRDSGRSQDPTLLRPERVAFVEAVSGIAALCIDSQRLLERQKQLLDAFIQLIAGAIDAKSPYTGGHCQRVPEIALALARAAADSQAPAFRDFTPGEEDWEALHIAAWLHDCGKVTTPEYVVDKATKLETVYDRIHEVRTRFEVLKRDAWVAYWRAVAEGADGEREAERRDRLLAELDDDFAFVARCNRGGETMAEADLERLQRIAGRTWWRTLDDRLGVSWEEAQRQARQPAPRLPVQEALLADRPEQRIERPASEHLAPDNPWGFHLDTPTWKFDRGELHNLSVQRGTLTPEERYVINHHMVQTILMLERLPFPPHLSDVAEYAGGHHERMDGSGFPRGLTRAQMSLPARIMAVADVFEALTAVDRPYKAGKPLSEALGLMAAMCRDGHIDPDLFGLFLESGVPFDYARRFLDPEQLDTVDVPALRAEAGLGESRA